MFQEYFIRHKYGCPLDTEIERRKLTLCLIAAIERRISHVRAFQYFACFFSAYKHFHSLNSSGSCNNFCLLDQWTDQNVIFVPGVEAGPLLSKSNGTVFGHH